MLDARFAGRVSSSELEQDVDERAGLEVLAVKPLVEQVEDRQQLLLGAAAAASGLGLDPAPGPALLA